MPPVGLSPAVMMLRLISCCSRQGLLGVLVYNWLLLLWVLSVRNNEVTFGSDTASLEDW